jgi:phosphoserine phosphatase RsbU/P
LWVAATETLDRLDTWGMLIGLEADSQYEDAQVRLEPGDTVLYYTDGFTDAADKNGDRFDEENLAKAFCWACQQGYQPQAILDYLFEQVQQFIGAGNRNGDDMTLVVLQVKSS